MRWGVNLDYSFAREVLREKGFLRYYYGDKLRKGELGLEGGKYVFQINEDQPIHPAINSFMTLLFERNYMKLYEKDYIKLYNTHKPKENLTLYSQIEWAERYSLKNNVDKGWTDRASKEFSSNAPPNLELDTSYFSPHTVFRIRTKVSFKPWQRYQIRNGIKSIVPNSSPTLMLEYQKAIPGVFNSQANYDQFMLGIKHQLDFWHSNEVGPSNQFWLFLQQ